MGDLSDRLRHLGSAVAEVSDREGGDPQTPASGARGSRQEALARARNAFVSGAGPSRGAPRRSPWIPALAAAACLALAGGGLALRARGTGATAQVPTPISFSVGAAAVPGVVGEWVAAGPALPLQTHFSDGSALDLSPGARMRVTTTNPAGADVLIERGSVHAAVVHPAGAGTARWAVRAGPFEVRVTGTTFDAAWDPMAETFVLTMIEGRVLVTGPNIPPDRMVVGGERLVVSVRDGRMVLSTGSEGVVPSAESPSPAVSAQPLTMGETPKPPAQPVTALPHPPETPQPAASGEPAPSASPDRPAVLAATPAWKELAAKGKYRDAFAAAEAAGFGQEIERVPAGDLLMLADAARFSGSPARARDALLAARRRFGTRGKTAFLLGKIAVDQQGSPGDAVGWFEAYLREEPGGPLAEQALGRILDISRRGSPEAGRRAAARYLARYPDGSYAALARSLNTP